MNGLFRSMWWQHKWTLLCGLLLALITLIASVALLSLSGWFITAAGFAGLSVLGASQFNYFLPAAGVRLFALLRIVARYGERVVTHQATFKILSSLRVRVYDMIEPLAPAHLIRYRSGDLLNRLIADIEALDNLYLRLVTPLVTAILVIIAVGYFFSWYDMSISLWVMGMLVTSGFILPLVTLLLGNQASRRIAQQRQYLREQTVMGLQSLTEQLVFQRTMQYQENIDHLQQRLYHAQQRLAHVEGLGNALFVCFAGITLVGVLWLAAQHSHHGLYSGTIMALLVLGTMAAFEAVMILPRAFKQWGETATAMRNIQALEQTPPAVAFMTQQCDLDAAQGIDVQQVSFAYPAQSPVLDGFSLQIRQGEHVAIVGPSGVGKTTLLHILARIYEPQAGQVMLAGCDVKRIPEQQLRQQITLLSQHPHLFQATLRENISMFNTDVTDEQVMQALETVQLSSWFAGLAKGLDTWLGEQGILLSGGQRQRLAIARALCQNAPIWLLDEPTEWLDYLTERQLIADLQPCLEGKTVVLVTHRQQPLALTSRCIDFTSACSRLTGV